MDLKGYSAWITVDGIELKQYSVEVSPNGDSASCWVPSEAGKVRIYFRDCSSYLAQRVFILGVNRNLQFTGGIRPAWLKFLDLSRWMERVVEETFYTLDILASRSSFPSPQYRRH